MARFALLVLFAVATAVLASETDSPVVVEEEELKFYTLKEAHALGFFEEELETEAQTGDISFSNNCEACIHLWTLMYMGKRIQEGWRYGTLSRFGWGGMSLYGGMWGMNAMPMTPYVGFGSAGHMGPWSMGLAGSIGYGLGFGGAFNSPFLLPGMPGMMGMMGGLGAHGVMGAANMGSNPSQVFNSMTGATPSGPSPFPSAGSPMVNSAYNPGHPRGQGLGNSGNTGMGGMGMGGMGMGGMGMGGMGMGGYGNVQTQVPPMYGGGKAPHNPSNGGGMGGLSGLGRRGGRSWHREKDEHHHADKQEEHQAEQGETSENKQEVTAHRRREHRHQHHLERSAFAPRAREPGNLIQSFNDQHMACAGTRLAVTKECYQIHRQFYNELKWGTDEHGLSLGRKEEERKELAAKKDWPPLSEEDMSIGELLTDMFEAGCWDRRKITFDRSPPYSTCPPFVACSVLNLCSQELGSQGKLVPDDKDHKYREPTVPCTDIVETDDSTDSSSSG